MSLLLIGQNLVDPLDVALVVPPKDATGLVRELAPLVAKIVGE